MHRECMLLVNDAATAPTKDWRKGALHIAMVGAIPGLTRRLPSDLCCGMREDVHVRLRR
jgi:hypothetical protein